jgi:CNP1-like family
MHKSGILLPRWLLVTLIGLVLPLQAVGSGIYGEKKYGEFYEEEKKWSELEVQPPDFPKPEELIEIDAGSATANRYFVAEKTLQVGQDGVVRYVLVVKTAGGTTNVSFEGIRCGTKERKLYAFGRNDNSWSTARNPGWQTIRPGSYHAHLFRQYFCPNRIIIYTVEEGVDALKRGGHPEAR